MKFFTWNSYPLW